MLNNNVAEFIGGAEDGDTVPVRHLVAFLTEGEWHLYERVEGTDTMQYVGTINEAPHAAS